jgi:hypothetical protein
MRYTSIVNRNLTFQNPVLDTSILGREHSSLRLMESKSASLISTNFPTKQQFSPQISQWEAQPE